MPARAWAVDVTRTVVVVSEDEEKAKHEAIRLTHLGNEVATIGTVEARAVELVPNAAIRLANARTS